MVAESHTQNIAAKWHSNIAHYPLHFVGWQDKLHPTSALIVTILVNIKLLIDTVIVDINAFREEDNFGSYFQTLTVLFILPCMLLYMWKKEVCFVENNLS